MRSRKSFTKICLLAPRKSRNLIETANIFVCLDVEVNTGSKSSLTLSKAVLVLSSLPVHINNRYNWCDSAISNIHVCKGVVVSTGNMSLDVYILTQNRPLNAILIYTLDYSNRSIAITKTVTHISTLLYFMPN